MFFISLLLKFHHDHVTMLSRSRQKFQNLNFFRWPRFTICTILWIEVLRKTSHKQDIRSNSVINGKVITDKRCNVDETYSSRERLDRRDLSDFLFSSVHYLQPTLVTLNYNNLDLSCRLPEFVELVRNTRTFGITK